MTSNKLQIKFLIIGAGLSGLSTAYHLGSDYVLIESTDSLGGSAGTLYYKGFKLDNAVHILYCCHQEILDWIRNTLGVKLLEKTRNNSIWLNETYVRFPIQYNLADLPFASRYRAFASLCKTIFSINGNSDFENFEQYSLKVFGKYLTDIFIRPYNEKLFGTGLDKMIINWMGDYVPVYSKYKMILSVFNLSDNSYGRNSKFYYPIEGGTSSIAKAICQKLKSEPIYNSKLISLSLKEKTAFFSNGLEIKYDNLINTIPLDYFLQTIRDLPQDILHKAKQLKKNSTTILHLLIKRNLNHNNYHWVFIPDNEIPFYRITFPGNINPANCPEGYSSITLEFGGDVYKKENIVNSSIKALKRIGIIANNKNEIELCWKLLNCGYVIYDTQRYKALELIFPFLQKNQIWSIGRYGNWEYSNMEDAIMHGIKIAKQLKNI